MPTYPPINPPPAKQKPIVKPVPQRRPTLAELRSFEVVCKNSDELTDAQVLDIMAGIPADGLICMSAAEVTIST
jgi:hypothetical protein